MGLIKTALDKALKIAEIPPESGATVALSRKYAGLLDEAAPNAKYRKALELMDQVFQYYLGVTGPRLTPVQERAIEDARIMITVALGEHSVASDLGPKYLAVLAALGLTVKAAMSEGGSTGERPLQSERQEAQRLRLINGGRPDGA